MKEIVCEWTTFGDFGNFLYYNKELNITSNDILKAVYIDKTNEIIKNGVKVIFKWCKLKEIVFEWSNFDDLYKVHDLLTDTYRTGINSFPITFGIMENKNESVAIHGDLIINFKYVGKEMSD